VVVRDGTEADLDAIGAVWRRADGMDPALGALPLHRHELDRGTLLVAERGVVVVGFAGALVRDGVTFLADLFVDPAAQSTGVGRALLGELFRRHPGDARYTASSADRRARHLYRAFGMTARCEIDYLEAAAITAPPPPTCVVTPVAAELVVDLDARWYGRRRWEDHDYWRVLGAEPVAVERGGAIVGVGYVRPDDRPAIGPLVVGSAADAADTVAAAVAHAATLGQATWRAYVPRPHPGHRVLLGAGFAAVDTDLLMVGRDGLLDTARVIGTPDVL
jgi:ribosomal protein S18 acetylase RimI-like enzyme